MKHNWLYVVLIIVIVTGVLCRCTIPEDTRNTVSLLVTVMGVVFALYFVIISIDASKQEKELKRIGKKIERKQADIKKEIETIQLDHLDKMYSHQIELAKNCITNADELKKMQESVRHSRAKLATQSKFLSLEVRKQRITELGELGDQLDISDLKKIIEDPTENKEIKELAWGIRDIIRGRIMGQQSDATGNMSQNSTLPSSHTSCTPDAPYKKPQIDSSIALMIIIVFLIAALLIK